MKLHYSQTPVIVDDVDWMFYYLMKLHYSQTKYVRYLKRQVFYYLMKLHYSQTGKVCEAVSTGFTTL